MTLPNQVLRAKRPSRVIVLAQLKFLCECIEAHLTATKKFDVVAYGHSVGQARPVILDVEPEILLADAGFLEPELLRLLGHMQRRRFRTRPVLFNAAKDHPAMARALQLGVMGYLAPDAGGAEFLSALDSAVSGKRFFSSSVAHLIEDQYVERATQRVKVRAFGISPREEEIAERIHQGESTKQIAEALGLSIRTVEKHRQNIHKKSGVG